jgi:integrase
MGTRSKKKSTERKRSIKIQCTDAQGQRCELYVPHDTDPVHVAVLRKAAKLSPGYSGRELPDDIREGLENLPLGLRKKVIALGWIKGKPDEVIPKLSEWLESCRKTGELGKDDYQKAQYLIKHHGDVRLDLVTIKSARGFRSFFDKLGQRRGKPYSDATINKAIQIAHRVFKSAVYSELLKKNPYENVKGGSICNPDGFEYVSAELWQSAVDLIPTDTLKGRYLRFGMAIARWQGLRIPSEIRDLKFSAFDWKPNGDGYFDVPKTGKTGLRGVSVFAQFVPYFKDYLSMVLGRDVCDFKNYVSIVSGLGYVCGEFRERSNSFIATEVKKIMKRAGMEPWKKFMQNQRRSFIWDLKKAGWAESDITAICGNTPDVRKIFYYYNRSVDELAAMGNASGSKSAPPSAPPFPPESGDSAEWRQWAEVVVEQGTRQLFGLDMSGKELLNSWESSYELKEGFGELSSMISTVCDFANGKISEEEAEKRIDDHSYRAAWFRDEALKKAVRSAQENEEKNAQTRLGRT